MELLQRYGIRVIDQVDVINQAKDLHIQSMLDDFIEHLGWGGSGRERQIMRFDLTNDLALAKWYQFSLGFVTARRLGIRLLNPSFQLQSSAVRTL